MWNKVIQFLLSSRKAYFEVLPDVPNCPIRYDEHLNRPAVVTFHMNVAAWRIKLMPDENGGILPSPLTTKAGQSMVFIFHQHDLNASKTVTSHCNISRP